PPLRSGARWGDIGAHRRNVMIAVSARRTLLPLSLVVALHAAAHAQATVPARAPAPAGATAAWTLKLKGDIRWQQVTPAGALLVSTDEALSGVDIERGVVAWEKQKSTRLNSSHEWISYAVFCLKKKIIRSRRRIRPQIVHLATRVGPHC